MIQFNVKHVNIKLKFMFFAVITIFLIVDKQGFTVLTLLASLTHELGHLFALIALGNKPKELVFEIVGIRLVKQNKFISYNKEILILFAGPLTNIIIFFVLYFFFKDNYYCNIFSLTNLFIGIFNLLPVGNLDGGQILNLALKKSCELYTSNLLVIVISIIVIIPVILFSLYLLIFKNNFTLTITSVYLLFMLIFNKYD